MSKGGVWDKQVLCPFFREPKSTVECRCESEIPNANLDITLFRSKKDRDIQSRVYCCDKFEKCEKYRSILLNVYMDDGE